jgi:hypothetical protein
VRDSLLPVVSEVLSEAYSTTTSPPGWRPCTTSSRELLGEVARSRSAVLRLTATAADPVAVSSTPGPGIPGRRFVAERKEAVPEPASEDGVVTGDLLDAELAAGRACPILRSRTAAAATAAQQESSR